MLSLPSHPKQLAAAGAACALVPAGAQAMTVGLENGTLTARGEAGDGSLFLTLSTTSDAGTKYLTFGTTGASRVSYDQSVCHLDPYLIDTVVCNYDPAVPVALVGTDLKDNITIVGSQPELASTYPVTIDGRGGDDILKDSNDEAGRTISGGPGNDTIEGLAGNDTLDGGDGNDEVNGNAGNDTVRGGSGDDVVNGDNYKAPGADVIDGGPGNDQIDDWTIPSAATHPQPAVSLDGAANDGRPGEGDNVINVEKLDFHVNATFTGTDGPEVISVLNVSEGASSLSGLGGNDVIKGGDSPDTVDGGAGDDDLNGGNGNDVITGGPGRDTIVGDATASGCYVVGYYGACKAPWGNDTINAQDGEVDSVDCGPGQDTATVDAGDVVTNCETVNQGAAAPAPGAGAKAKGNATTKAKGITIAGAARIKALLAGRLTVGVPCAAACRVTVTAKAKGRTIATGRATLLEAGTAKVTLKVAKKAKRSVRARPAAEGHADGVGRRRLRQAGEAHQGGDAEALVRAQRAATVAAGGALLVAPGMEQAQAAVADMTHAHGDRRLDGCLKALLSAHGAEPRLLRQAHRPDAAAAAGLGGVRGLEAGHRPQRAGLPRQRRAPRRHVRPRTGAAPAPRGAQER
jgi:Ca2+-binding RTX toxin-like protein